MYNKLLAKSLLVWLCITPLGILNGGLREYFLFPLLGAVALPISGLLLMLCIFAVSYIFIPRLGSADKPTYVKMGFLWVVATIIFESLIGVVTKATLTEMLQAYNILTGNLWSVIVIFIGFVPTVIAKLKKL